MNPQEVRALGLYTKDGISQLVREFKPHQSIAVVADLHAGAKNALALPTYTTVDGLVIQAPEQSVRIYRAWLEFWRTAKLFKVDTVCLLGDAISGTIKIPKNIDFLPEIDEQKEMAIKLLKPMVTDRKLYVIDGSGFHDSLDARIHHEIAERLNGNYFSEGYFILETNSASILFSHNIRSSSFYPTGILEREAIFTAYGIHTGKIKNLQLVVGAHWHTWSEIHRGITYTTIPGWQAYYSYRGKMVAYGIRQPDIGGLVLLINGQGYLTIPIIIKLDTQSKIQ